MKRQFEKLRRLCGSHSAAARFLGYAPGWYRHLRNTHISAKTADYIRLKAAELLGKSEADFVERQEITGRDGPPLIESVKVEFVE